MRVWKMAVGAVLALGLGLAMGYGLAFAQETAAAGAEAVPELVPVSKPEDSCRPGFGCVTNLPLPRFVSLKGDEGNARRGPGLTHRIDWVFTRPGMPLMITAK